jgi:hypothetical protein
MDRDGSNRKEIFPESGAPGLDPQRVIWSPSEVGLDSDLMIALIYQGDIWLINPSSGQAQQITGDNQVIRIDWK